MRARVTLLLIASGCGALLLCAAWRGAAVAQGSGSDVGGPLPGLSQDERKLFDEGAVHFAQVETMQEGLGPVFNGRSCAECHAQPAAGGSSPDITNARVTRFARIRRGQFDPMVEFGGPVVQRRSLQEIVPSYPIPGEVVPKEATLISLRMTTPLYGAGLIEAIPDEEIVSRERRPGQGPDGIAGIANRVLNPETGRVEIGRFGWKAQNTTLHHFAGEAYLNEMGITSPFFPTENLPQGKPIPPGADPVPDPEDDGGDVTAFTNFMRLLAPARPRAQTRQTEQGRRVFSAIGCTGCHVPAMRTGNNPSAALRSQEVNLYSDLLLHEMGPGLADGMVQGSATGSQWRTAPLWGLSRRNFFIHDGNSPTVESAIGRHGGEATTVRNRYQRLRPDDREALLAFLHSL